MDIIKTKFLWLGMYADEPRILYYTQHGCRQDAAYRTQKCLLKGIEEILGNKIDTINAHFVPSYPKYKKIIVRTEIWSRSNHNIDIDMGFVNLKFINYISRAYILDQYVKKWAMENTDLDEINIIVYSLNTTYMRAVSIIKKMCKNVNVFVLVMDLPLFNNRNASALLRYLKYLDWQNLKHKFLRYIDGYILCTDAMANYLGLQDYQWIRVEGVVNAEPASSYNTNKSITRTKVCLYAGKLEDAENICTLVDAFIKADVADAELHIYGAGPLEEYVKNQSQKYKMIKYNGYVSNEKLIDLEKKATLLCNVRNTHMEYTKYSCPSKVLEYLASGTPVYSTKLAGIPREYKKYLFWCDEPSVQNISSDLKNILNLPSEVLNQKGTEAQKFMLKEKNSIKQATKILDFIEKINRGKNASI